MKQDDSIEHPDSLRILASYLHFSSLNTLTLNCRKAFDHASYGLSGSRFAKVSDDVLLEHAVYWAKQPDKSTDESLRALRLLREIFRQCSEQPNKLLKSETLLQKRVGLLKQHADRAAAHLSLEDYAIHLYDLAHFTASICLIGEIIRYFDSPDFGDDYYNNIDANSYKAAIQIFPMMDAPRLFEHMNIKDQARWCWRDSEQFGINMLLNQLPYAISWF